MSDWALVYDRYEPTREGVREALCTLGNGYFCTRGAAPDCDDDAVHYPGTYIAGLYNRATSIVAGREVENEDLVNVPNWLPLTVRIDDGTWFRLDDMEIVSYRQELDLRQGMLLRTLRLRDEQGRTTRWRERRIVSMADQHLAALALEIEPEDWSGRLGVRSALNGTVCNNNVARYQQLNSHHLEVLEACACASDIVTLRACTRQSRTQVAEAARTRAYRGEWRADEMERHTLERVGGIGQDFALEVSAGERITIEKIAAVYTCRDRAIYEPGLEAMEAVRRAERFDALHAAHREAWSELWDDFDMMIEMQPDPAAEMKLRVHIFHLLQTVSPHSVDQDVGVPARGWGEAYRGHIFWDELFIFPLLNLRRPVLTNALLRYRFRRLPAARRHAAAAGFRGALYPGQSGSDGREETQVLHLNPKSGKWVSDNTHRQRHINAAVAYNIWHYYDVTVDHEFMNDYGAEMFLEIARFWDSIATYNNQRQRYEIRGVWGRTSSTRLIQGSRRRRRAASIAMHTRMSWPLCTAAGARRPRPAASAAPRRAARKNRLYRRGSDALGRNQPQALCPFSRRRHHQSVRWLRSARGVRLGDLSRQVRRHPAPRSHSAGGGRFAEPLQGLQAV